MAKIYSENSIDKMEKVSPKEETVNFLLNYSKALSIISINKLKFESLLN